VKGALQQFVLLLCPISIPLHQSSISVHVLSNCGRNIGPFNEDPCLLLNDLGRQILAESGDLCEVSFLFHRVSVVVSYCTRFV